MVTTRSVAGCLTILTFLGLCISFADGQTKSEVVNIFAPAPRELRQRLSRADKARNAADHAEYARELGELMSSLTANDYLVLESSKKVALGMRAEVAKRFRTLSPKARQAYEDLYGAQAEDELTKVLESDDLAKLQAIADRWFHTSAGYEATMLLGRRYLDERRVDEAVSCFSWLTTTPAARRRFEPEVSVLLSSCYLMLGNPERSRAILAELKTTHANATMRIGGETMPIFNAEQDVLQVVSRIVGNAAVKPNSGDAEWRLPNAKPSGNPVLALGDSMALPSGEADKTLWKRSLITAKPLRDELEKVRLYYDEQGAPVLAALQPLNVGRFVVTRNTEQLLGIDAATGKTIWSFPPSVVAKEPEQENANVAKSPNSQQLWRRMLSDRLFGQFSSDGQSVFFLDQLPSPGDPRQLAQLRFRMMRGQNTDGSKPQRHNRLVAVDLARQGAIRWMVGGLGAMDAELAGAFFLGAPLPIEDQLFVMLERDDFIELAALSAVDGRFRWSLKISPVGNRSITVDAARRLTGATPTYEDGLLVCPTSTGGLAVVDPLRRSFVWGAPQMQNPTISPTARRNLALAIGNVSSSSRGGGDWQGSPLMIAEGRVFFTPANGPLTCRDLKTGELIWARPRTDALFVGCIHRGAVLVVGRYRFTALNIEDGKPIWERSPYVAIPGGGVPSGRGFHDGKHYLLPTSDPELLRIDMTNGDVQRVSTKDTLGNLAARTTSLVSQRASTLIAAKLPGDSPPLAKATVLDFAQRSNEELTELLGDSQFAIREAASGELLSRGGQVIEHIGRAAQSTHPEVAFRAATILSAFLRFKDVEIVTKARKVLEEAKNSKNPLTTSVVAERIKAEGDLALKRLQELGATLVSRGRSVRIGTRWKGESKDLAKLTWVESLTSLELLTPRIDDAAMEHVGQLEQLDTLSLRGATVSDRGLKNIRDFSKLRVLILQSTQVSDQSIAMLKTMKSLRAVNLLHSKFTADGVKELKKALPDARIIY